MWCVNSAGWMCWSTTLVCIPSVRWSRSRRRSFTAYDTNGLWRDTGWRMQKATALLQKAEKKLIDVERSVGYDSDAAFSKAFKRVLHLAPRQFRKISVSS